MSYAHFIVPLFHHQAYIFIIKAQQWYFVNSIRFNLVWFTLHSFYFMCYSFLLHKYICIHFDFLYILITNYVFIHFVIKFWNLWIFTKIRYNFICTKICIHIIHFNILCQTVCVCKQIFVFTIIFFFYIFAVKFMRQSFS